VLQFYVHPGCCTLPDGRVSAFLLLHFGALPDFSPIASSPLHHLHNPPATAGGTDNSSLLHSFSPSSLFRFYIKELSFQGIYWLND
jgi:hypothetical protein